MSNYVTGSREKWGYFKHIIKKCPGGRQKLVQVVERMVMSESSVEFRSHLVGHLIVAKVIHFLCNYSHQLSLSGL